MVFQALLKVQLALGLPTLRFELSLGNADCVANKDDRHNGGTTILLNLRRNNILETNCCF